MRTAQAIRSDKVGNAKIAELEPKEFRVPTLGSSGIQLILKTQQNRNQKRDFTGNLILRDPYGKEVAVVVDRDVLIDHLRIQ